MAGKGKPGKKKNRPKHHKQQGKEQRDKADDFVFNSADEDQVGEVKKNELGKSERTNEENRESEKDALPEDDYELLEGVKKLEIAGSSCRKHKATAPGRKIPNHTPSARESAFLRGYAEEVLAHTPVHTSECRHQNLERDIDDCGNNMCWAIMAMRVVCWNLQIKGGSKEMIELNLERLLECYKEDKTGYPYIIRKAFKYIKEHKVSKEDYYPLKKGYNVRPDKISEEVEALRLSGFQMIDHKDEDAVLMATSKGPIIGGVKQSPEFTMLGNKIYKGSDHELVVGGKYCNHAVMVVGYKTDEKTRTNYWKVEDVLATRWGVDGCGKVARDSSLPEHRKHLLTTTMYPKFE